MTLVVGRQSSEGRIRITADMRLMDEWNIKRGYPYAVLKNIILDREHVVAYAGNSSLAVSTIRRLRKTRGDELVLGLLCAAEQGGTGKYGVEFILAEKGNGLRRIRHTGAEQRTSATWIGHHDAFRAYQELYHGVTPSDIVLVQSEDGVFVPKPASSVVLDFEEFARMNNAFGAIEWSRHFPGGSPDPAFESVGEAFITACTREDGFHYETQAMLSSDAEQEISGPDWTPINWGTVANGGFGFAQLCPTEPGVGLVGLYLPHAGLGLVYHPLSYDGPAVYRGLTHDEFVAAVQEDHGVLIDGARIG